MIFGFILLLLGVSLLSLSLGSVTIYPWQWLNLSDIQSLIIWEIRLPRLVANLFVGAALAVSGVALQALFRNPLADAGLIGVASSAALGAVLVMVVAPWFFVDVASSWLGLSAFLMALLVTLLLYRLATQHGVTNVAFMLLAGIAFNALTAALTGLLIAISTDTQMRGVIFWMMGSFSNISWDDLWVLATVVSLSIAVLFTFSKQMDVYLLGENVSQQMGFDATPFKRTIVIATALMVGVSVSIVGVIGFVGLIVPHIMRLLVGVAHDALLKMSAIGGALLIVLADLLARTVVAPTELPIGLLMALLGAPFFLYLLIKNRSVNA